MRVRRRQPCQIEIDDRLTPDIGALLRGTMRLDAEVQCHLLCPVTGERIPLSRDELALVATLDARDWVDVDILAARGPLDATAIAALAARGGLLSDADTPEAEALRKGEDDLHRIGWHRHAAIFHAMTQWRDVEGEGGDSDTSTEREQRFVQMVRRRGLPPAHFFRTRGVEHTQLPVVTLDGGFGELLRTRATTRHFHTDALLPLPALARVLFGAFGVLGIAEFAPGVAGLRKSSPSGGSLHPIEAYVLAINVADLRPGLYHYEADAHQLALVHYLSTDEARATALSFTSGQTYFAEAQALVVHVARADRNFWKYQRHAKAYKVLLLDSGHLSQTFYLLAAEQGLGAFYTAAINDRNIADVLQLPQGRSVALGINGLGIPDASRSSLHLPARPVSVTRNNLPNEKAIAMRIRE